MTEKASFDIALPEGGKPASKIKRGCIGFLLSILVPGLGQVYNGQLIPGFVLGIGFLAFQFLAVLFRLPFQFRTGVVFLVAVWTLQLAAATHAAVVASRQAKTGALPRHTWRSYAIAAAILGTVVVAHSGSPDRLLPVRAFNMTSKSMSPTLIVGDHVIADMGYYRTHSPDRGDVIIFKMPITNVLYTKRVIAVGGDSIQGSPGVAILNGQTLSEPYAIHDPDEVPYDAETFGPVTIPSNELFVMGDNRDASYDSREYGPVDASRVVGKVLFIYYSRVDRSRIGRAIQ